MNKFQKALLKPVKLDYKLYMKCCLLLGILIIIPSLMRLNMKIVGLVYMTMGLLVLSYTYYLKRKFK